MGERFLISDNMMLLIRGEKKPVTFHLKYPLGCGIHCLTLALSTIQKYSIFRRNVAILIYLQKHFQILNNPDKFCVGAKPIWVKYVDLHIAAHYFLIVVFVINSNTNI